MRVLVAVSLALGRGFKDARFMDESRELYGYIYAVLETPP